MRARLLIVSVLATVACESGGSSDPRVLPPTDPVPLGCRSESAADVPLLALPWDRSLDTFLLPDRTYDSVAIDYDVRPRQQLVGLDLEYDYDPLSQPDEVTIEDECLQAMAFDDIDSPVTGDDVVSISVSARGAAGDQRTGRLTYSRGDAELTIRTTGLDAGDPANGSWWFVLEPAAGTARVVIAPARLDRSTLAIRGLPDAPAVVALVQLPGLTLDSATGAVYAPAGLALAWRRLARGWYGAAVLSWPETTEALALETIVAPGASTTDWRRLGDVLALDTARPRAFAEIAPRPRASRIEAPCEARAVRLTATGFVMIDARAGDVTRHIDPGGSAEVPVICAPDAVTASIELEITNLNWRYSTIVAELELAEGM